MKRFWYILFLFLLAFVAVACGGTTNAPLVEEVAAESEAVASNPVNTNDLTLIGETGRPQFLNAFASW